MHSHEQLDSLSPDLNYLLYIAVPKEEKKRKKNAFVLVGGKVLTCILSFEQLLNHDL